MAIAGHPAVARGRRAGQTARRGQWLVRGHLREVTAEDICGGLDKLRGHRLCTTISAVRSLFPFARKHGLIIARPPGG